jgi:hypothetical protein
MTRAGSTGHVRARSSGPKLTDLMCEKYPAGQPWELCKECHVHVRMAEWCHTEQSLKKKKKKNPAGFNAVGKEDYRKTIVPSLL